MTIFRVDFDSEIGIGHLMRSLVYAKEFRDVLYVSKRGKKEFVPYELVTIQNEDEFFDYIEKLHPAQVVVDNYDFTLKDEKAFKKRFPTVKLSVFDDDYRQHHCDEIINHNISADKNRYPDPGIVTIIPPLIREEFHKEKGITRKKIYDIFIAIGGTDTCNMNIPLLQALPHSVSIAVVTTSTNANLKELQNFVHQKKNIALHVDSKEIAKLMNQSRIVITTPSVIIHEVLFMGIDFIAIKTESNQDDIFRYLQQKGYFVMDLQKEISRQDALKDFIINAQI